MNYIANISRNEGDPKILQSGPSGLGSSDRLARGLGWFSIGLGLAQLLAPRMLTRMLGIRGKEGLIRFYGARELGAGMMSLSVDKQVGLWSRVAGDGLDIVTLARALHPGNAKRGNVKLALVAVLGVTLLDVLGAHATTARHARTTGPLRRYGDRSGFPQGVEKARGAARDFAVPDDMRQALGAKRA